MTRAVPFVILALATLGVARAAYSLWRQGAFEPFKIRWRGASSLMRGLVLALALTAVAYGSDKILGGHIGEGMRTLGGAVASLCTNVFTFAERRTGYAASAVRTNETHDLTMPENAQMAERIARRGAHNDGFWFFDAYTNRLARVTNRIKASAPSLMPEDIELTATFTLEGDQPTDVTATTTAVVLEEVVVPSAPDTGLVVLAGSSVAMEAKCRPRGADLSEAETDWFLGRRRRDGSHDNWHKVATNESGVVYSCPFPTGGIYRLKTDVTLAGERETTFFKIKSRDTLDPPKKYFYVGGYDHIGVVSEAWQRTLRNTAFSHLGSTAYAESAFLGSQHGFAYAMPNTPKCNFFVAHIAEDAGLSIPGMHGHNPLLPYPPLANDWATGSVIISGWSHLSTEYPEPGWIVGHPNATGSGHCGIVDYDGFGIAAGRTEVNRKDPRFFDGSCGYNKTSGGNVE